MNFRPALKSYEEMLKKNGVISKKPVAPKIVKKENFRNNAKKNTTEKKKK
ncbi:dual specificity protein phosphatase 16 / mitogen-activated protein kinase phosphatase 7 [Acanthocystis turfacea Chlorella virus Canal-1]|nr:dual specificity protein phosphatase 16 / mitogen-activated protein kinase phosphatase 7 [Acanthocystis turfacea Chlorella virus Canal-1]